MCYSCGHQLREEPASAEPEEVAGEPEEKSEGADQPVDEDEVPCPNCKTMVSKDAIMCYACGVDLRKSAPAESAESAPSEDEKKPQVFVKKIVKRKPA
jgi:hypothetical protein